MQIQPMILYENTWVVDDNGVRIFILAGKEKALIIDTGMSGLPVRDIARQAADLPLMLLNTHQKGKGRMLPVFDGDLIDLGGRTVEVVHVPGHTPGSITVLDKEERCLIGGDPIQEDGDIYMFGLHRDMEAYIAGLERLWQREKEFDFIYPSHAELKVSKSVIPKLISGAKDILTGKCSGTEKEVHGMKILSVDIGVDRFLCDLNYSKRH